MKQQDSLYLAALVIAAPRMNDGVAFALACIAVALAVAFDVMDSRK